MARTKKQAAQDKKAVNEFISPELVMKSVTDYLDKEGFKYLMLEDKICEIVIQGDNLSIQLMYYVYNNHLILRVPHFIRNVDVMRPKVVYLMNYAMNEILDIRFEVGQEGKSISSSVQHLLGDTVPTEAQLRYLTMLIINVTDNYYQKFIQAIYSGTPFKHVADQMQEDIDEGIEETEEMSMADLIGDPLKIN